MLVGAHPAPLLRRLLVRVAAFLALMLAWGTWQGLPRARAVTVGLFALVVVAILFTGQHHLPDLVTGAALGALVLTVAAWFERAR